MRNEHKAHSFIAFFTSTSQSIIMVFNTGETSEELKAKYNPEGSLLRRVQLRMLDMLMTQCAKSSTSATALMEELFWVLSAMEVLSHGTTTLMLPLIPKRIIKRYFNI